MSPELSELAELDKLIHEPARLTILAILYTVAEADFLYLLNTSGLTKGNLSAHLNKLETAGYVEIEKTFKGKLPLTVCRLTPDGRERFEAYRRGLRQVLQLDPAAPGE